MKKFTLLTILLILALTARGFLGTPGALAFSDSASDIYAKGIDYLTQQGVINGYPDGTFKPEKTLNRAEMLKIIVEATADNFDSYSSQKCFEDVPPAKWFTKHVCYAKEQGWIVGYEGGRFFRPEQAVSFVEALKITLKGFKIAFTEGDIWYKDLVERASAYNLIPHTVTSFSAPLPRNRMADLIARSLHQQHGTLSSYLGDRAAYNVTYDSIAAGLNLSTLEEVTLTPR